MKNKKKLLLREAIATNSMNSRASGTSAILANREGSSASLYGGISFGVSHVSSTTGPLAVACVTESPSTSPHETDLSDLKVSLGLETVPILDIEIQSTSSVPPQVLTTLASILAPQASDVVGHGGEVRPDGPLPEAINPQTLPLLTRKWTSVLKYSSSLEEIGTPTEHSTGVPFILIPDENIEAAKEEFKDFIYAQFHGPPPEMGRVIGVVNALWTSTGPWIFVYNIGPGSFLLRVTNPRTRFRLLS